MRSSLKDLLEYVRDPRWSDLMELLGEEKDVKIHQLILTEENQDHNRADIRAIMKLEELPEKIRKIVVG